MLTLPYIISQMHTLSITHIHILNIQVWAA